MAKRISRATTSQTVTDLVSNVESKLADEPVTPAAQAIEAETTPVTENTPVDEPAATIAKLQAQLAQLTGQGSMVVTLAPAPAAATARGGESMGDVKAGRLPESSPVPPANVPDRTPVPGQNANGNSASKPAITPEEEKLAQDRAKAAIKAAGTFGDRLARANATIDTYSRVESLSTSVAGLKVETGKLASFIKLAPKLAKVNVKLAQSDRETYGGVLAQLAAIDDYVTRLNDAGRKAAGVSMVDTFRVSQLSIQPAYLQTMAGETGYVLSVGDTFSYRVASVGDTGPVWERVATLPVLGRMPAQNATTSRAKSTSTGATGAQSTGAQSTGRGAAIVPHPHKPGVLIDNTVALRLAGEAGDRRAQECVAKLDSGQNANRTFSVSKEAPAAFKRLGWTHPANS